MLKRAGWVDDDFAPVPLSSPDPLRLPVRQSCTENVRPARAAVDGAVDDRFATPEIGEHVGADAELSDPPS